MQKTWFFYYKGRYEQTLNGAEIRNLRLAEALIQSGHRVTLSRRGKQDSTLPVPTLSSRNPIRLALAFLQADILVLHGGGPLILLLASLSHFFGTKVILDAYAPHWLERFASGQSSLSSRLSMTFNLYRTLYATALFDLVLAANQRQQDLYRGLAASSGDPRRIEKIHQLGFGAEPPVVKKSRQSLLDFANLPIDEESLLIGWVGGLWEWFDTRALLEAMEELGQRAPNIKLLFFGLSSEMQAALELDAQGRKRQNLLFLPYVPYSQRLEVWSGLDAAIVWTIAGLENDYASRSRNFDCISAHLPIIQNRDHDWAPLIEQSQAGRVIDAESDLAEKILTFVSDERALKSATAAMTGLYQTMSWYRRAEELTLLSQQPSSRARLGSFISLLITASLLIPRALIPRRD